MKKLFKFLSLALVSISLLLPSASAIKPIDEYMADECKSGKTSEQLIDDYAQEIHEEYKRLGGSPEKTSPELTTLRKTIANALKWLDNLKKGEPTTEVGPKKPVHTHDQKVHKANARLTLDLLKLFFPEKMGKNNKYNPENIVGGLAYFDEKKDVSLSLDVFELSPPPPSSPEPISLVYTYDESI